MPQLALSEIIPSQRRIQWQGNVGIPGGIPNRTTIHARLSTIDNTGTADVRAAIQSALNSCPINQVVLLPSGTFRIGYALSIPHRVVLRGSGAGSTTIISDNGGQIIRFYGPFNGWQTQSISSGYTKGSTSMVLANASGVSVGLKVQIQQTNDSTKILPGSEGTGGAMCEGQWVEVTGVSGKTITFSPPLFTSYKSSLNPRIRFPKGTTRNFVEYAGLENLTLTNQNVNCQANILMDFSAYCWIKNIKSNEAGICHVWAYDTFRCEIRDSYFHGIRPLSHLRVAMACR